MKRAGIFRRSVATGTDFSEADGRGEFLAEKEPDLNRVRVGDERYEIPDAVALGS